MTSKTLPPASARSRGGRGSRSSSRRARSMSSSTKFPSIIAPRPTLISPDFSNLNPQNRINVLHPPTVPRRTVALETGTSHLHLHNRSLDMQRRQSKLKHGEWRKPMYGTPVVKELYRSDIRSTLKGQIDERMRNKQRQFDDSLNHSIRIFEKDRRDCMDDRQKRSDKLQFLFTFTQANKQMMEERWRERRERRNSEVQHERELLRHNPINWSHTLK